MFLEICFSRKDSAIWVSHKDMIQYFSRLFRRAQLPVYFSQGFNPHPKMIFALPLAVGMAGEREYIVVRLEEDCNIPDDNFKNELARCSAEGLKIIQIQRCESKESFFDSFSEVIYRFDLDASMIPKDYEISRIEKMREIVVSAGKKGNPVNIADDLVRVRRVNNAIEAVVVFRQNGIITDKNIRQAFQNILNLDPGILVCTRTIISKRG